MVEAETTGPVGKAPPGAVKILRIFAFSLYGVALLAALALVYLGASEIMLKVAGTTGRATVVDLRDETYRVVRSYYGAGGTALRTEMRTHYYVTFRFATDGQDYRQERLVSEGFHRGLAKGQTFPVRYLAAYPEFNRIDPDRSFWGLLVSGLLVVFFGSCGWLFHRVSGKLAATERLRSEQPQGA
ncbi:DUF3592 domain-containing protein [uncultured Roseibium sp.]|uniref:DUF3592 domain-containing protein n=1 Tax=uncultured Roseibium sp. TaxID=1936171 RepID=UPI0032168745